jgi:hypothetical protein
MSAELERRLAELSAEIRHYPTPIARCDEQLTALLEERARLMAQRDELGRDGPCGPEARWTNDGGTNAA